MNCVWYWGFIVSNGSLRVTVSVVTIKGEECRIMELGQVADATGGDVSAIHICTCTLVYRCFTPLYPPV